MKYVIIFIFAYVCSSSAFGFGLFENSVRRDPVAGEQKYILNLDGCTGFLIRNSKGKNYVGTARHCYDYGITAACKGGAMKISHPFSGASAQCVEVTLGDSQSDFAIIEVAFSKPSQITQGEGYSLMSANVNVPLDLSVIGFPADPERRGKMTVTENCRGAMGLDYMWNHLNADEQQRWEAYAKKAGPRNPQESLLKVSHGTFNCSIWGGNSGGPVIVRGTQVVLGLPMTYLPFTTRKFPKNFASQYELASDLLLRHKTVVREMGLVLVNDLESLFQLLSRRQ